MSQIETGKPPFGHLRYCVRWCMAETQEGLAFDEWGVCRTCQSGEQKIHIDWVARKKELRKILEEAKRKAGTNYDGIICWCGASPSPSPRGRPPTTSPCIGSTETTSPKSPPS